MFTKLPTTIIHHKKYQNLIAIGSGYALVVCTLLVMYGLLPIILNQYVNAQTTGLMITGANIITFLVAPIAGSLADRSNGLLISRWLCIFVLIGSTIWLFGGENIITIILMCVFYFIALGCNVIEGLTLKNTNKKDGGKIFGFILAILSVGYLCSTILLPYFTANYYPRIPILTAISAIILLGITYITENPKEKQILKRKDIKKSLNIIEDLKLGVHFVKTNHYYPVFALINTIFRGIFYAGIWFLIPLTLSSNASWIEGLQLGIYEIIAIIFASIGGILADKYNRKKINILGRILIMSGALIMIVIIDVQTLIIIGSIIGLGNILIYGAGNHILEETDEDHTEDGSYAGLQRSIYNLGFVISPFILGTTYSHWGFQISLGILMTIIILLGTISIWMTQHFELLNK